MESLQAGPGDAEPQQPRSYRAERRSWSPAGLATSDKMGVKFQVWFFGNWGKGRNYQRHLSDFTACIQFSKVTEGGKRQVEWTDHRVQLGNYDYGFILLLMESVAPGPKFVISTCHMAKGRRYQVISPLNALLFAPQFEFEFEFE